MGVISVAENKTLCIACKYKFHDRDLQPCADCLRATQLVQRGVDRYQKAAEPKTGAPVPETRRAHPSAKTLCFACKYMYCDWEDMSAAQSGGSGADGRLRAGNGAESKRFMNFAKDIYQKINSLAVIAVDFRLRFPL